MSTTNDIMNQDDEVLALFLEESIEHLESIEEDLLTIEKEGENCDDNTIDRVFRAMHTIKGGAGFFGLTRVKDLTHVTENMLDLIRKKQLSTGEEIVQCLFSAVDLLNEMFSNPSNMEEVEVKDTVVLINRTVAESIVEEDPSKCPAIVRDKLGNVVFEVSPEKMEESRNHFRGGEHFYLLKYSVSSEQEKEEKLNKLSEFCCVVDNKYEGGETPFLNVFVSTVVEADMAVDFFEVNEDDLVNLDEEEVEENIEPESSNLDSNELDEIAGLLDEAEQNSAAVEEKELPSQSEEKAPAAPKLPTAAETSLKEKSPTKTENLRVNVQLLERLMAIAGELVLARNQLVQALSIDDMENIKVSSHQINMVTSQLQEAVMKTRMQPVGKILTKFKRVVRDLSSELGKKVELTIEGESVEIDKNIIESINDPLTHIIRNSMDHGFETPAEREAAGKSPVGQLKIRALQETGKVIVEVIDDGRGIDPQKVGTKALEKGLISEAEFNSMSRKDLINLIFKPGFSTNEQVTEISGRGVGMDVVLTNLSSIGGVVEVNSEPGQGTHLRISLPLTLAIMPSLLVGACDTTLALPQVNLVQIVRIPVSKIQDEIKHIGDSLVIRFMEELIPVVRAEDFLEENVAPVDFNAENFGFQKPLHIAVVAAGEFQYGIIVDQTFESSEIVVKALGKNLKELPVYSGATILGDGTIAPILDVHGIMQEMKLNIIEAEHQTKVDEEEVRQSDLHKLLIINNGHEENFAVLMKNVLRVERIYSDDLKQVGSTRSCEIDGKSLAIFSVDDTADVSALDIQGQLSVIVFEVLGRQVGLLTKEIVDSIEIQVEFEEFPYKQPGIFGSTYINEKLCLLVDFFSLVATCKPQWVEGSSFTSKQAVNNEKNILVVDDSNFFLNQICSFLEEVGYNSVRAENGREALDILKEKADQIDLVLTDIEMPVMDGWELIESVKANPEYNELPLIALTSVSAENAVQKGMKLGVDEYLIKLDREEIILTMKKYLSKQNDMAIAG